MRLLPPAVLLPLALLLMLASPARAHAEPFGELPFTPLGVHRVAACLDAVGGDGVAIADVRRFVMRGVRLHRVLPTGELVPDGAAVLGEMFDCPDTAAAPTGAAVTAGEFGYGRDAAIAMTVRDPGGQFGVPLRVELRGYGSVDDVQVAVAPDGAAVVAWSEYVSRRSSHRLRVVRRPAGGAFGAPVTLADGDVFAVVPAVAMDADGTATIAWSRYGRGLEAATAAPGRPFGPSRRLHHEEGGAEALELAASPDGGLLLVDVELDEVRLYERAPGERALRAGPVYRAPAALLLDPHPAAALAAGGGAVVAWFQWEFEEGDTVQLVRRAPGGGFTKPVALARIGSRGLDGRSGPPLAAAVGADGRAVVGWLASGPGYRRDQLVHARVAAGTVAGGLEPPVEVGGAGRSADGVAALATPRALLWTDNLPERGTGTDDYPIGHGRLHRALAGVAPAPAAPVPQLTVSASPQRIHLEDKVVVKARCSAACDLRAVSTPPHEAFAAAALTGAGTATLRLAASGEHPLAARDGEPLSVLVRATAPGGAEHAEQRIAVPLRRAFTPPPEPPRDVRVVRRDGLVTLRFRTERPARREQFLAKAFKRDEDSWVDLDRVDGEGRRRFEVIFSSAADADYIVLRWRSTEPGFESGRLRIAIPGAGRGV